MQIGTSSSDLTASAPGTADNGPESDGECLRRFDGGEREAFAEIVIRHEAEVRRLLLGLWDDRHEVDDLCQEVFVRLMERAGTLSAMGSVRPWLYRTALNLVRDRARRRRVRRLFRLRARRVVGQESGTAGDLEHRELVDRLRAEIQYLRPAWREVIVLRDLVGLSPDAASEVLGVSANVVTDRLYRARRDLAARLGT